MINVPNYGGSLDQIEYRALHSEEDYNQCINLQKNIFKLPDSHIVSPLFLNLITRDNPPVGISVGIFSGAELIGFIISFATFFVKSIYVVMTGIKENYQKKIFGYKLLLKFRELSIAHQLETMYGVFDPLEVNLARLYFTSLGFVGVNYETEAYTLDTTADHIHIPIDKVLVRWDFNSRATISKLNGERKGQYHDDSLPYPAARHDYFPDAPAILVEIPDDFHSAQRSNPAEALTQRLNSRKIFVEYINRRKYCLTDCLTIKTGNNRKSYYLIEKI